MDEGIRINDAALEITPGGLEALLQQKGAQLKVTRLDCCVSESALNELLKRPRAAIPPQARIEEGRLTIEGAAGDRPFRIELEAGKLRIELASGGLRIRTEAAG